MPVTREMKEEQLEFLKEQFDAASSVVLTDFTGLTVNETVELRSKFRDAGVVYKVVKNTLARRAVLGTSMEAVSGDFKGPIGVAFGGEDPGAPARVVVDFIKDNEQLQVRAACLDGTRFDGKQIDTLAKMPSKNEIRAMLLATFNAPAQSLVGVLSAPARDIVGVLNAYADKKGE